MGNQLLGISIIVAVSVLYFFIRKEHSPPKKPLKVIVGALVIAAILVIDDLFTCMSSGCDPDFLNALALKRIGVFATAAYVHVGFAIVEVLFYLAPLQKTSPRKQA